MPTETGKESKEVAAMAERKSRNGRGHGRITLWPLTPEEAIRRLLQTTPTNSNKKTTKKRTTRKSKQ